MDLRRSRLSSGVAPLVICLVLLSTRTVRAQPMPSEAVPAAAVPSPVVPPPAETPATRRAPPQRFGPFTLRHDTGDLCFGLATQLRTTLTNDGGVFGDGNRDTNTSVEIRRLRLAMRATLLQGRVSFLLQLSTAPNSLELVDAAVDVRVRENLFVRVGQFKTPFTMHRARSFQNLPMTEWDTAAVRFGAERQIGAEVHTAPGNRYDATFGVFTGVNARSAFARGIGESYDLTLPNPSNLRAAQAPTEFHPELFARLGTSTDGADPLILSDANGGPLRAYGAVSLAYDLRPTESLDFTARAALEGMLKFRHVTLSAEGYLGMFTPRERPIAPAMLGATVDATYRLRPRLELAARYSMVGTLGLLRDAALAYVDRLVLAGDPADAAAIRAAHANAGTLLATQEFALGLNVPIVGRSLVFQFDAGVVRTDRVGRSDDVDAFRTRAQVQFAF